jgi:Eukaryotic-type carbonic anhydrase.
VWPLEYPQCSGARQSPINLQSDDMYRLVVPEQLRWHGYWDRPRNLTLTNNGHTSWFILFYTVENKFWSRDDQLYRTSMYVLSVQLSGRWELVPYISGGPLEGEYVFSQLHFHWGTSDNIGSEHTVGNFRYLAYLLIQVELSLTVKEKSHCRIVTPSVGCNTEGALKRATGASYPN